MKIATTILMSSATAMLTAFSGAPAALGADMAEVAAQRLARLDHIRIEYVREYYKAPLRSSPLDSAQWETLEGDPDRHVGRLTIVRPNALHEFLTDRPELGWEPFSESVSDSGFVRRYERPGPEGQTYYEVTDSTWEAGCFAWIPVLQVFDVQIQSCDIPGLNIPRLLREYDARAVRSVGTITTYAVSGVPMLEGLTQDLDFDLNERGTCLRLRAMLECPPSAVPTIREQYVLSVAEVNGAELPTEAIVAVYDPRLADYWGITRILATSWSLPTDLCAESIRIEPQRRNAVITELRRRGGGYRVTTYGEDGDVVRRYESPSHRAGRADAARLGWRRTIPPIAGATGIAVVAGLCYAGRRSGA